MALSALVMLQMGIVEPLTADGARLTEIPLTEFDLAALQLPTATLPFTKASVKRWTLTAGTVTIDLRALPGLNSTSQDCNGLKVVGLLLSNPAGNGLMTLASGNYDIDTLKVRGDADDRQIGALRQKYGTVDNTHKTIVVTGTGTQSFDLEILLG